MGFRFPGDALFRHNVSIIAVAEPLLAAPAFPQGPANAASMNATA